MIGVRAGIVSGVRPGLAAGLVADPISNPVTGIAGVTRDASSLIYVPSSTTEWTTFLAATSLSGTFANPDAIWLFQEASGAIVDQVSARNLAASGTGLSYQTTESGWSRKGVLMTDGGTGVLLSTDAGLPDISVTSALIIAYMDITATPASTRAILALGTTPIAFRVNTTPRAVFLGPNSITGTNDPTGQVRPYTMKIDRTGSVETAYDNQQKYQPVFSATPTGKQVGFGAVGANCAAVRHLGAFMWFGANAEKTDANIKALLQALGYTIPWS